jgi:hypothetical protein
VPSHWGEILDRFYEMIRALRLGVRHGMPPWLAAEPPFVVLTGEEGKKIRKKTEETDFCYEVGRNKTRTAD